MSLLNESRPPAPAAITLALVVTAFSLTASAQSSAIGKWRMEHERQIVDELLQLVSLPNVAGVDADMRRNAEMLKTLFERRGFRVELSDGPGSPVVLATLD